LVNFPGNWDQVYPPLLHSDWWGITFTDLIAPFFLFTVGVSISLTNTKQLDSGIKPSSMYKKIFIRSLKIFAIGMFLNAIGLINNFNWQELRWTGTLHRISIVFLVCSLLFIHSSWRTQAFIGALVLVLYCIAMTCIPTPGYGKVMLEPSIKLGS
jgi:predicted acyltransferase